MPNNIYQEKFVIFDLNMLIENNKEKPTYS